MRGGQAPTPDVGGNRSTAPAGHVESIVSGKTGGRVASATRDNLRFVGMRWNGPLRRPTDSVAKLQAVARGESPPVLLLSARYNFNSKPPGAQTVSPGGAGPVGVFN